MLKEATHRSAKSTKKTPKGFAAEEVLRYGSTPER
jgi:hypothetical protein